MLKAPDPVRSPQLSNIWTSQYYGGGPHGNTGCCSFCIFFIFFIFLYFVFFVNDKFNISLKLIDENLIFFYYFEASVNVF